MVEEDIKKVVPAALDAGYRLFDTAAIYRNERYVGEALREALKCRGLRRSDVFVTSKLQPLDQGYDNAKAAINHSLANLGLDYIDMYLIHWPGASGLEPSDVKNKEKRMGSWKALEEALAEGKLRAVGVSNYMTKHLEEMEEYVKIMPMVNQIEIHPLYYPAEVITYCQQIGIHIQAYSSLGRGRLLEAGFLAKHPQLSEIAAKHKVTVGQICLRWALQHGFSILPKSSSIDRIKTNAELYEFCLDTEEMGYLDRLHHQETEKVCWDPQFVE